MTGPTLDERAELSPENRTGSPLPLRRRRSGSPKQPMSPKNLAPLVIPTTSGSQPRVIIKQQSSSYLRLGSEPPSVPPKSARMLPEDKTASPQSRTPYTPLTGSTTNISSVSATPVSATTEGRASPLSAATSSSARGPSPMGLGHTRGQSESSAFFGPPVGHRRERSDASIMDRGRPKKRPDGSPITIRRTASKQLRDQKAFETLPHGVKALNAGTKFNESEIDAIKRQAVGQAAKFEVLGFKDVEALSRVSFLIFYLFILASNILTRNSVALMNAANTSAKLIILFAPAAATFTSASALTFALRALHSSPTPLS